MMMNKEDYLWNQFVLLEDEIRKAGESNLQILGIVAAAATAILAAGISQPNPNAQFFTFLCVYIVTLSGYRLIEVGRRRTWRISTYIQVFIESELEHVKWETRLDKQRYFSQFLRPSESSKTYLHSSEKQKSIYQADVRANPEASQFFSSLASTNEAIIIISLNWIVGVFAVGSIIFSGNYNLTKLIVLLMILTLNIYLTWTIKVKEKKLRRFDQIEREQLKSWKKLSLIELSKENSLNGDGWINYQIVRESRKIFETLSDQEIQNLFEDMTSATTANEDKSFGEIRESNGIKEWRCRLS